MSRGAGAGGICREPQLGIYLLMRAIALRACAAEAHSATKCEHSSLAQRPAAGMENGGVDGCGLGSALLPLSPTWGAYLYSAMQRNTTRIHGCALYFAASDATSTWTPRRPVASTYNGRNPKPLTLHPKPAQALMRKE